MLTSGLKIGRCAAAINKQSVRTMDKMVCFPKGRMPFYEKCIHGVAMFIGIMAVPTYIAVNFKNYRPPPESQ